MIFLVGLPFAHLLCRQLDPWHGQSMWAQGWVIVLFALSLSLQGRALKPNRPLGAFVAYVGLFSLSLWVNAILSAKVYPLQMLQGVTHLLLIFLAYWSALTSWSEAFLKHLTYRMAQVGVGILLYGVLQLGNFDQFFASNDPRITKDVLVGTLGNTSHFASHLSLLLPLLLLQPGRWWKLWSGITLLFLLLSKSLGGQVAAFVVLAWWMWHGRKRLLWVLGLAAIGAGVYVALHSDLLNPSGRLVAWIRFWEMFTKQPITGLGAGFVMEFSRTVTDDHSLFYGWRHVHNEYFQAAIEYGLIGVGLLGWMAYELIGYIRKLPMTPLVVALCGILLAFGVNSLVIYPAHLWVTGSYALVAYCGLLVLHEELT